MLYVTPIYSRERLNAAAKVLLAYEAMGDEWDNDLYLQYEEALPIINNWRSAHAYPLTVFQTTLRRYARKLDPDALIAQRIKRLSSITAKLKRFEDMRMSQIQDIGGCRAIVRSMSGVRKLAALYDESDIKHQRASYDDYLKSPKESGYRGIHLVYRYVSDKNKTAFNGLKIELQLRSRYQHAWATAVETVGTFVQQALKSSKSNELEKANESYINAEKRVLQNPGTDAVLVSVDSLAALARAYPNYFADTRMFLELLRQTLVGQRGKVDQSQLKFDI